MTHPDAVVRLLPSAYVDEQGREWFFGRNIHHDPRSRNFAFSAAPTGRTTMWTHYGPVLNQGSLGSCTGNAMVQSLMSGNLWNGSWAFTEDDAVSVYSRATEIDPFPGQYPPTDTGSDGVDVCKVAQERGWIVSYDHAFDFDSCLAALEQQPVLLGFPVYQSFLQTGGDGVVPPSSGNVVGGHEVALIGVDYQRQQIRFVNSWGDGWADGGFGWFPFDVIRRFISDQTWCDFTMPKVAAPGPTPPPPPPPPGPPGPTPPPAPPANATLTVVPSHGARGTNASFTGSGFAAGVVVGVYVDGGKGGYGPYVTNEEGGFTGSAPIDLTPGQHALHADDAHGHTADATFTVDGSTPPPSPPGPDMTLTPADLDAIDRIVAKQVQTEIVKALDLQGVSGAADPRNAVVKAIIDHGDATWRK